MKERKVTLVPTGWAQTIEDIQPGMFVILDDMLRPVSAGVKSEYGPEHHSFNEAGEYCGGSGDWRFVPVKVVVEDEEL